MEPNNSLWIPQLFETIRIIFVAAIPMIILYFNYKARIVEKRIEMRFKAREHMYKSYQHEIDSSKKIIDDFNGLIGRIFGEWIVNDIPRSRKRI